MMRTWRRWRRTVHRMTSKEDSLHLIDGTPRHGIFHIFILLVIVVICWLSLVGIQQNSCDRWHARIACLLLWQRVTEENLNYVPPVRTGTVGVRSE